MRIALCQLNPIVGDIQGNGALVVDAARRPRAAGAVVAVLPEQVLAGYPAVDLWLKHHFVIACRDELDRIASDLPVPCVIGYPQLDEDACFNAAAYVADGRVEAIYRKQHLPNYAVFDEERWFTSD